MERGHALAYAWNCSMSAAEAVLVELRAQNQQLLGINNELAAGQEELSKELKAVDFLRLVANQMARVARRKRKHAVGLTLYSSAVHTLYHVTHLGVSCKHFTQLHQPVATTHEWFPLISEFQLNYQGVGVRRSAALSFKLAARWHLARHSSNSIHVVASQAGGITVQACNGGGPGALGPGHN